VGSKGESSKITGSWAFKEKTMLNYFLRNTMASRAAGEKVSGKRRISDGKRTPGSVFKQDWNKEHSRRKAGSEVTKNAV